MSLDTNNTFNVDFECPVHSTDVFGFKYLLDAPLEGFFGLHYRRVLMFCAKKFPCSTSAFLVLLFYAGAFHAAGDSCSVVILKVKVNFNC